MTCLLHNKLVRLVAGIAFLLVGSTVGTASAEDWKVHPAATCQPANLDARTNYFNSKGHLVNPTNSNLTVICPIVRDHHAPREGPKEVKIRYIDQNPSQQVSCRMESRERWGKLLYPGPSKFSPTGTHRGDLVMKGPNGCGRFGGCFGDLSGTYYQLVCSLPAKNKRNRASSFISYFVKEDD